MLERRWMRRVLVLAVVLAAAGAAVVVALVSAGGGHAPAAASRPAATRDRLPSKRKPPRFGRSSAGAALLRRRERRVAVPILIYHVIAPPIANAPFPELYVPAPEFAAQMRALAGAGFHAVTLDQVHRAWEGEARLPDRPVVVSFDNGYRTQDTNALPVLHRLGWVGVENIQLSGLPPSQGGLSVRQVRGLLRAGWELDTQGWSHADLTRLDTAQLRFQIAHARAVLRRRYHVPANWFCYPSGRYDRTVIAAVRAAGFRGSTTVVRGWARATDDPYRLPRLEVLGGTSPRALLQQVAANRTDRPAPPSYPSG
jgi:peptidoglycan/xylan/chitin deacetylase (PgdA/CDA1 family)